MVSFKKKFPPTQELITFNARDEGALFSGLRVERPHNFPNYMTVGEEEGDAPEEDVHVRGLAQEFQLISGKKPRRLITYVGK